MAPLKFILEPPEKVGELQPRGRRALDYNSMTNGLVAAIFAATGPLAIILAVANSAGLQNTIVNSWVFAAFFIGGVFTVLLSLAYRQPIAIAWTMPGAALLISALDHMSFSQAVGAFLVAGLFIFFLGLSGVVSWVMEKFPTDVVMAMVAGVFLPFALNLIHGLQEVPVIAGVSIVAFLILTIFRSVGRFCPPMFGALLMGMLVAVLSGDGPVISPELSWIATPILIRPEFTISAMIELVVPLVISVLAVQNIQGVSVLTAAGYRPPINVLTVVCGYGSFIMGIFGSVPTCLTGPANAILVSSGQKGTHFVGAILFGALFACIGLLAPVLTEVATSMTPYFIMVLGGLAMLPVLSMAFKEAFSALNGSSREAIPPLITFVVTISNFSLLNIAAPFWAILIGCLLHLILKLKQN